MNVAAVDARFASSFVDLKAAELQHRAGRFDVSAAAPQHRSHARKQFARRERLRDVVVGAKFETDNAIDFFGARSKHHDRYRSFFAPQRARDVVAVDAGQSDVENQQVGSVPCAAQSGLPVGHRDDAEPVALEMVFEQVANCGVVFRDDDRWRRHTGGSAPCQDAPDICVGSLAFGYDARVSEESAEKTQREAPEDRIEEGSTAAQLSEREVREAVRRVSPRAAVVFETVRREGQQELERSNAALAFSGLAAGLSMGFSLVATGMLRAILPAGAPWSAVVAQLGYTLGFLIVVLGRQQLFTENTVTAIIPLLDNKDRLKTFGNVVRLWSIVLATNLVGALLFALLVYHSGAFSPEIKRAFLELGNATLSNDFGTTLVKGVFAGWLIALMVWLLPGAEYQRLWVIIIITFVVGAAGLSHIIAGSVEALYAVVAGAASWSHYFIDFLIPVFIGNSVGGVLLVSIINYAQVAPENPES